MIDVAVLGAGRIGAIHARNLSRQPGARIRYVVDPDRTAADALAAAVGAETTSPARVFDDPAITAVAICSSTDTHAEYILRATEAGKQIFCEKPVDLSVERARQCADAVDRSGVVCMIGFQRRFDPTFSRLKERLDGGEIGDPEVLIVTSRDPGAPPLDYIRRSGGIFRDMLIHDFDMFRWILEDEAAALHATASVLTDPAIGEAGDADTTAVTIRTRGGRLCQINTSRRAAYGYDQRLEVHGSRGMLQAGNHRPSEVAASTDRAVSTDLPEHFFLERYRVAYANEMAHFLAVLAGRESLRTTVADGVKALELADAAAGSWHEGRVIRL